MESSPQIPTDVAERIDPARGLIEEGRASREDLAEAERRRRETIQHRNRVFRRLLALADVLSVSGALFAGAILLGDDSLTWATVGALLLLIVVMKALGLYDRDEHLLHKTTLNELPALFEVATLTALLLWMVGDFIVDGDIGRRQVLGMWMLLFLLLVVGRACARNLAARWTPTERCLVIGDAAAAVVVRRKLALSGSVPAELVGWVPIERIDNRNGGGPIPEFPEYLERVLAEQQVHRVVLAPGRVDTDALMHVIRRLKALDVSVSILPATPQVIGSSVELDHIHGLTLLGVRGFEIGRSSRLLKRSFDVVLSGLLLILLSPLLLAIAIAIKLGSPGKILFRQRRVGRHGEAFEMLKFRSMYRDADQQRDELLHLNEAEGLFKIADDPRITRVGRILRRWSLDELPQLVNVLRGDMSLVGPRPLIAEEDSRIEGYYRRRLDLAPGITGDWQALGSARIPLDEMVRLDYLYVASWSLWGDVRILLRTIPYVIGRRGL
jgi:exopolysaccharide biosynthesis polyprenyl glycosylphosphotransferase